MLGSITSGMASDVAITHALALLQVIADPAIHQTRLAQFVDAQKEVQAKLAEISERETALDVGNATLKNDRAEHQKNIDTLREATVQLGKDKADHETARANFENDQKAAIAGRQAEEDATRVREINAAAKETALDRRSKDLDKRESDLNTREAALTRRESDHQALAEALEIKRKRLLAAAQE